MREIDVREILAMRLFGRWRVVRRGRPSAPVRVVASWPQEGFASADARFDKIEASMRQGMVALVNPDGGITRYASEPMVRTRW